METLPIFRWLLRLRVFEWVAGVGFEPTTLIHVLIYARDLPACPAWGEGRRGLLNVPKLAANPSNAVTVG